ncbi:MAG: DUF3990 domain-containing protein [Defluviitaleaceae bacterium]|nr:DUF3990 domain-containing protein [Defluviitaleaceae bacterium]
MRLYHGSNQIIEQPDPTFSKRSKMDFGKGFYTTTSEEQARRFTHLVFARSKGQGTKTINVYDLDISAFSELKVKDFQGKIDEWFDYVEKNRRQHEQSNDRYDIVIGPVADDNIQETFLLYEDGIINKEEAIRRLKYEILKDQIVFKSPLSIMYLRFLESLEVV